MQTAIVLDNLPSHHSAFRDQQLPANVEFVFLPPYSPENWFSELKEKFRKRRPQCTTTDQMHERIESIIEDEGYINKDLSNYYQHCHTELLKAYHDRMIFLNICKCLDFLFAKYYCLLLNS